MEPHPALVRGRSAARVLDGLFTLAVTGVVVALLGLTVVVGWMDGRSFLLSLSVVGFGFVIGAILLVAAQHAWCCRECGVGLQDDAFVRLAPAVLPLVRDAVDHADAAAVDAAVRSHPHPGGPGTDLDLAYCPRCCAVAVARLERPPGPGDLAGPDGAHRPRRRPARRDRRRPHVELTLTRRSRARGRGPEAGGSRRRRRRRARARRRWR